MTKNYTIIDIETGGLPNAAEFIEEPKCPGNIKKAESIATWERDEKPKLLAEALDKAALSPLTGRVLCIGILEQAEDGKDSVWFLGEDTDSEKNILTEFWEWLHKARSEAWRRFVTHNGASFDWPFLIRRSWAHGVQPVRGIVDKYGRLDDQFADTMVAWGCGDRTQRISLDKLAKFIGLPGKTGSGADFSRLWASDRAAALEYLRNDLSLTLAIAERML